jgi:uncharacterized integral membrane protein
MNRNVLIALILIVLSVLILIVNRQDVTVDFAFASLKAWASVVYLCFICLGVVIGMLLK